MPTPKQGLILAILSVSVVGSFSALSNSPGHGPIGPVLDPYAFQNAPKGVYYREIELVPPELFQTLAEKRNYYLASPDLDKGTEVLDSDGDPLSNPDAPWWTSRPGPLAIPESEGESETVLTPFPTEPADPIPSITMPVLPAQSLYYYDRGSLRNGTELEPEGPGYVKVFRDRDGAIGGRGWGARSMINLIRDVALEFSTEFPWYERLQVADISRRVGGKLTHESHQNGLDADIIYLRKNRKEQPSTGAYGRNGFAEQFVVRTQKYSKVSSNFDAEANFNLVRKVERMGNVKIYFMDKLLIREFFRYAEAQKLTDDPDVQSMLMKLNPQASHADHFHVRLFCQETDKKCISATSPPRAVSKSWKAK